MFERTKIKYIKITDKHIMKGRLQKHEKTEKEGMKKLACKGQKLLNFSKKY